MESKWRFRTLLLGWLALVGAIMAVFAYPWDPNNLRELRGTLHYPLCQIGGETTGVVIMTANGPYELDLRDNPVRLQQLASLKGKPVIVSGELTVSRGIEVAERRIIHVRDLKLDTSRASTPPVVGD